MFTVLRKRMIRKPRKKTLVDVAAKKKSRQKEDVAARNVAPVRSKSAADVVAKSVRTERVVALRESDLPIAIWAREIAGGCCMSGCCMSGKVDKSKSESKPGCCENDKQAKKDGAGGCCEENHK
ncbi:uncharacterized protein LOC116853879 isoform X1 [Odontomachus brunneus]|uniref:uncharacterized protein LOC116853879 isoform X1 n=1 Tax=Odontomachus brunneus TaxID=486640 RepID=UPI0013F24D0E|nr:uncharacterized protein LOC116853879 isoform X1 [Odontomachus brunneus]